MAETIVNLYIYVQSLSTLAPGWFRGFLEKNP